MRLTKIAAGVAMTAVVAGGTVVLAPSPASAYIDRCNQMNAATWASAYCWGSPPSTFYVSITCRRVNDYEYAVPGNSRWAGGGITSVAYCDTGDYRLRTHTVTNP